MPKSRIDKTKQQRVHENRNAENVQPVYANWAQVLATGNEFRLTLGEALESTPERLVTREMARVYMTPRVAKALLEILRGGIERHEKAHGTIATGDTETM